MSAANRERALHEPRVGSDLSGRDYISLARYGCLGTCPDYTVTVYDDDMVKFEGRHYSSPAGTHTSSLSGGSYRRLLQDVEAMNIWALAENPDQSEGACQELVTDYPGVEIHVVASGRTRSVSHYYGCTGLAVEPNIDRIADGIAQVAGIKSKARGAVWRAR
jgi:Domain of unknown function (DUF6438)